MDLSEITIFLAVGISLMFFLALAFVLFFYFSQGKLRSEQIKAQQTQLELQERLLYSTILTQEAERSRIAKDLHDEIGSKLNVIHLNLHQLQRKAPEIKEQALSLAAVINDTIATTRRISHDLLPPTLENFGLKAALEELCENYKAASGLEVYLEVLEKVPLKDQKLLELNLFRILQELFSNTIKYAGASQIQLKLETSEKQIVLHYRDNGKGFDPALPENNRGLGTQNIKSRLQMIGGQFQLETAKGKGVHWIFHIFTQSPKSLNT